jgi:hypothetical protein
MSDEVPDPLAALDQIMRAVIDVAKAVWGYYQALVEQGFTADQALALTLDYQRALLSGGQS